MACTSTCYPQPPEKEDCDCAGQPCPCSCNGGAGGAGGGGAGPGGGGGPGGRGPGPGLVGFRARGLTTASTNPIYYGFGEVRLHVVDLMSFGYDGPWGHTRTYSNRLSVDAEMGNGVNWLVAQWPKLADAGSNTYVLVFNANNSVSFTISGSTGTPKNGARYTLAITGGTDNSVVITGPAGQVWRFTRFDDASTAKRGMFKSFTSPGGKTITPTLNGTNQDRIDKVERTDGTTTERIQYNYQGSQIDWVRLERQVGVTVTPVRQVTYTYYLSGQSHGTPGDLKFATQQVPNGAGGWTDVGTHYYRYYTSADSPNGDGGPNDLKMAFSPEAYSRLKAAYPSDGTGATDAQAAVFADHYFKYHNATTDTSVNDVFVGWVRFEAVRGGENAAASALYHYTYDYEDSGTTPGADYNEWITRTVETQPDGTQNVVFTNKIGQVLLKEVKKGANSWVTSQVYDSSGRLTQIAYPSAITSYSKTTPTLTVNIGSSQGLVRTFTYATSTTASDNADGDVAGLLKEEAVKNGSTGTSQPIVAYQYRRRTVGSAVIDLLAKRTFYRNTGSGGPITTAWSYGNASNWHASAFQPIEVTVTLPAVPNSQNGPNVAHTRKEYYDAWGNQTWEQGPKGYIRKMLYDIPSGGMTQRVEDVDTTGGIAPGWTMPAGGGLNVVTDYEVDSLGRTTQELGPSHDINGTSVRRATWTVYDDANLQVRWASGYRVGASTDTLINPVSITILDKNARVVEQRRATRASTSGKLVSSDTFAQSTWVRWTTNSFNNRFQREWTREYSLVPSSGTGSSGTNYDQTDFGYDSMERLNRVKQPGGTITRTLFEDRGLPNAMYVGTDDTGANDTDADGSGSPNNMVIVSGILYDANGNRTQTTKHVDASTTRVTTFTYDFRDRLQTENGEVDFFGKRYYDNLDRVTKVERYNTSESAANLLEQMEFLYDERGQRYQTIRYEINSSGSATGRKLTDNLWYDAAGNVIKRQPAGSKLFTKYVFDGLARLTATYAGYDAAETSGSYTGVDTVSGDTLFEQAENTYDAASNVTVVTSYVRTHTGSATGALTTSGTPPVARRTYEAFWHDALGRRTSTCDYGTNGGAAVTRPSSAETRSDTKLVTSWEYNSEGEGFKVTDPLGRETRSEFDAKDRRTKVTENYVDGAQSSVPDEDKITLFEYTGDDQLKKLTAKNPETGDQITEYLYGTTIDGFGLTTIATGHLLREINYPDKDPSLATDRVLFYRNRQGQVVRRLDQHDPVANDVGAHDYTYDGLGRLLHDGVTYLDAAKDGTVRRITYAYTPKGQLNSVQSWSLQTPGTGTQINEVSYTYTDFGLLNQEFQEHEGAKDGSTLYVQNTYDTSGSTEYTKGLRLTKVRYPNGRLVHYTYVGGQEDNTSVPPPGQQVYMADQINRLNAIQADSSGSPGTTVASYKYLGLSSIVEEFFDEAKLKMLLDYNNDSGYAGLDRFGRLVELRWQNTTLSSLVDRYGYGYDRNSNRTFRDNLTSANKDEVYTYDGLNQLKNMDRGNMVFPYTNPPTIQEATPLAERDFTFDATGNWKGYVEKTSGTTGLNQSRTHNAANEIGTIGASTGPNWADPTYDRVGNMVTGPKPTNLANSYSFKYDAWNRLVEAKDGTTLIGRYEYDGLHRRTKSHIDSQAPGSPNGIDSYRHFYYNDAWQILETRLSNSENTGPETLSAEYQWVWSARYLDSPVLREQISNSQRLYYSTDGNANVTSLFNTSTLAVERYTYDLYGQVSYYDGNWNASSSSYDNAILFGGYYQDKESVLYLARYRHLHSWLGRWLQCDPIGFADGPNLYAYVSSKPAESLDAFGLTMYHHWFPQFGPGGVVGQARVNQKCGAVLGPGTLNIHHYTTPLTDEFHGVIHRNPIDYNGAYERILDQSIDCCQFLKGVLGLMLEVWDQYQLIGNPPQSQVGVSVWVELYNFRNHARTSYLNLAGLVALACRQRVRRRCRPIIPPLYPPEDDDLFIQNELDLVREGFGAAGGRGPWKGPSIGAGNPPMAATPPYDPEWPNETLFPPLVPEVPQPAPQTPGASPNPGPDPNSPRPPSRLPPPQRIPMRRVPAMR